MEHKIAEKLMEELKPCPYSRPQISSAVDRMMQAAIKQDPTYLWPIDCYVALWALKNIGRAAPENKPLTMEELRRMDGEPVFAIPLDKNADWIEHWAILRKDIVTANSISTKGRMYFLYLKDYGKTWLAYARKPEGSAP